MHIYLLFAFLTSIMPIWSAPNR